MKLWDLYYWNKHEYCWKFIGQISTETKLKAIKIAKQWFAEFVARGDMMKVVEYVANKPST